MGLARLLVLFILGYILYRLIFGKGSRQAPEVDGRRDPRFPVRDILVEDTVCHTYIPRGQAIVYKEGDKTNYFCSEKCKETFIHNQGA